MPNMKISQRLSSILVLAVALAGVGLVTTPSAAAETYSATLGTAVQQLVVAAEDNAGYDRDAQFGDWIDADGDCRNTRHEVLVAESAVAPTFTSNGCAVTTGRWTPFYDGHTYTLATELQVDHLVPVAEAWGSGARSWTQERRVAFYNDLGYAYSLNAMPSALNSSKAASGPEQWLPPANQCDYIEAWTAVKLRWGLTADSVEKAALTEQAAACPDDTITVELAAGTVVPGDGPVRPAPTERPEPTDPWKTGSAPPPVPDEPGTKRLGGADRYATAAAIVQDSFPAGPVPIVFIATGESFADALAGGPAAAALGGPILPVAKAGIPAPILAELDRLDPGRIVILGGPGAISDAIATQLEGYTAGTVYRIAGANRYDTAANIATSGIFPYPAPQALIATGLDFADALAGGAVGAKTNSPVLLVNPNSLPHETDGALYGLQPRDIAVLGGTSAVSDAVLQQLHSDTTGGVNRLSGADRYTTAARISRVFWPTTSSVVYLATGRNFPDALAGVPAAGRDSAPLLLVEPGCMPAATKAELDRLQPTTIVVLGGTATVSEAAANGVACTTPAPAPAPAPAPTRPADKDCGDFTTQSQAQSFFDQWYPLYGDFARLDADGDGIACESLP